MIARRTTYVRLVSLLIAGAAAPSLAGACGGKSEGSSSGSSGTSGTPGTSGGTSGTSGGASGTSGGTSGAGTSGVVSTGCGSFQTISSTVDETRCEAQLQSKVVCASGDQPATVCNFIVEIPCTADAGAGDAGDDAGDGGIGQQQCLDACNAARPPGSFEVRNCAVMAPSASGGTLLRCGTGCGVGRPARDFIAQYTYAPTPEAERLAQMAQLEAASVDAFHALHADLERLGAPRSLLRAAAAAAEDEVRHADAVRRAAERLGARVPRIAAPAARARSLAQLAIENAEEGCVKETFGATLAAMQAANAGDARIKKMMVGIAKDELGHAAFSWQLAAWLDARLDAAGREGVARARRAAVAELRAELAGAEDAGSASLGLPDAATALTALDAMCAALESGDLARAA